MGQLTKVICLFLVMIPLAKTAQAQSEADLGRFEKEEKDCLDASRSKMNCVLLFKRQMDSLLSLAYNAVLKKSNGKEKAAFERGQLDWLHQQKIFNAKTDDQYSLEVAEKDFSETAAVNALSEKADFVRDRVRELLRKIH